MNLYRGCIHNCVYCDGRSENYHVDGKFGEDVYVKVNAIEVLRRELDPRRKRMPLKNGYIMIGGGVGDSYQPIEKKYQLTRKTLHLIHEYNFPAHILTKSTLVERDIDIIKKIHKRNRAIVSFSFSSADDKISAIFEPGVPPPSKRLETLKFFKKEGIVCGMFLLPVLPFITDIPKVMEETIRKASEIGVDFIIFGGMTLKKGKQKDYFLNVLRKNYPDLIVEYQNIYKGNKWGEATKEYYNALNLMFNKIVKKFKIPSRIPPRFYKDILSENDLVIVILEQISYLLGLEGRKSPYGYAAYQISKLKQPLSTMKNDLREIKGIGKTTEKIILEILRTGSSSYYEKILK
ncbi:MAG: radical SAM protein [Petrotogales bacterium]